MDNFSPLSSGGVITAIGQLILEVSLEHLPEVIEGFRAVFRKKHPDVPVPSEAEIISGLNAAYAQSLAKDEGWLGTHPAPQT